MWEFNPEEIVTESLSPLPGRFTQPHTGFRAGWEAVALAYFPVLSANDRLMDLGCGAGLISLLLGFRAAAITLAGVEIQPQLAALASHNLAANGFPFQLYQLDLRQLPQTKPELAARFDYVLANPPFFHKLKNRLSPVSEKNQAKFSTAADFALWVKTAAFLLKKNGCFCFILPRERFKESLLILTAADFQPRRLCFICPKPANPKFFLLEAIYNSPTLVPLKVLPDTYL